MPPSPRPVLPSPPRVVIVDGDRRVQQSLSDLLGVSGNVKVIGRAGDVRSALELIERERPDAVLVDPRLPDLEAGSALVASLARGWPGLRIVLTGWNDVREEPELADRASCFVSKGGSPEEFVSALVDACSPA